MECFNKACNYQIDNKCKVSEEGCYVRVENDFDKLKTPTYAEEQLEHAKDKQNRCYNESCEYNNKNGECKSVNAERFKCIDRNTKQPTPINYEEEYNKLKKELEGERKANTYLENEGVGIKSRNEELEKRYIEQEKRIEMQKTTIIELKEQIGEIINSGDKTFEELKSRMETERAEDDEIYKNVSTDRDDFKNQNTYLSNQLEKYKSDLVEKERIITSQEARLDSAYKERCKLQQAIKEGIDAVKEGTEALKNKNETIKDLKQLIKNLAEML